MNHVRFAASAIGSSRSVMAGLGQAIHVFDTSDGQNQAKKGIAPQSLCHSNDEDDSCSSRAAWTAGSSPAMTIAAREGGT
jgi:hypothetical protein